jgi:hypothetical protein
MRAADGRHAAPGHCSGFATVAAAGLLAVAALLCAGALHDALFGTQLALSRQLHQRAAALADLGVHDAMTRIAGSGVAGNLSYAVRPDPASTDSITLEVRHLGTAPLPNGYSASQFNVHRLEIHSSGHTARGIATTHVQGVTRALPSVVAATAP